MLGHRVESAGFEVAAGADTQVGSVHVAVGHSGNVAGVPGFELCFGEIGEVGSYGAEHNVGSCVSELELRGDPVARHHRVGIGIGDPGATAFPTGVLQAELNAGRPGESYACGLHLDNVDIVELARDGRRVIGAAVGDDDHVHVRHGIKHCLGEAPCCCNGVEAAAEQRRLVTCRHDDQHRADGAAHSIPVLAATEAPSRVQTSRMKSSSTWLVTRVRPRWSIAACTASPLRG